jgi:acyl dehydratase
VGDEIPPLPILITPTLIVSTAIASRDYQDVHHDRAAAEAAGSKDIFMNILSTGGFIGRYVTDWAGPEAILKKMSIRLGAPNYPDDTMRITGKVTGAEERDGEGWIELEVKVRNAYGDHATGSVAVVLPGRG